MPNSVFIDKELEKEFNQKGDVSIPFLNPDEVEKITKLPLFLDPLLQKQFDDDGYVKLSLLNDLEVADLKSFYLSLDNNYAGKNGFHVSLDNENEAYIVNVFNKLFGVLVPKLNPILKEYKPFTASYVIKESGLQNVVPPHQDWSFVDENNFTSATVWIPLMDVNKDNGALGVIKGSHKLFNEPRTSPSPQAKSALSEHLFTIFPYIEVIDMKAGEALVFNNKTIHASPANTTSTTRIGVGIGITQKEAQLLHYYQDPQNPEKIKVYKVDEQFFKKYSNKRLGNFYDQNMLLDGLELINTVARKKSNYTKDQIIQLITSTPGVNYSGEWMSELADLYNYNMDGTPKTNSNNQNLNNMTNPENEKTQEQNTNSTPEEKWVDPRSFFQKYSIPNILAEIKYRLTK